jgi:hypothetical protein
MRNAVSIVLIESVQVRVLIVEPLHVTPVQLPEELQIADLGVAGRRTHDVGDDFLRLELLVLHPLVVDQRPLMYRWQER